MSEYDKLDLFMKMLVIIEREETSEAKAIPDEKRAKVITVIEKFVGNLFVQSGHQKEVVMGDKYTAGQVGAQGPGAHAHDISFEQIWNQAQGDINLEALAADLATLRAKLRSEAVEIEHDAAIGAIAAAEKAAKEGDGVQALAALSNAGKWALDIASKIGVGVATAALKAALGL